MRRWILPTLALLGVGCTPPIAVVEVELGGSASEPMRLVGGQVVNFPVEISGIRYDDARNVLLSVEARRDGEAVATLRSCRAYTISHHGTSGYTSGGTQHSYDCQMTLPDGGADELQLSTKLDVGSATIDELLVHVRDGPPVGTEALEWLGSVLED